MPSRPKEERRQGPIRSIGGTCNPRRAAFLRSAILGAGAVLGGCVAAPEITVQAVDVVEVGTTASQVAIRMELKNAADVPVKLDMWSYELSAGGRTYRGRWAAGITLPANETVRTAIPAVIPNDVHPGAGCGWSGSGRVTYLIQSRLAEMLFELGLNRPTANFSGTGTTMGEGGSVPSAG